MLFFEKFDAVADDISFEDFVTFFAKMAFFKIAGNRTCDPVCNLDVDIRGSFHLRSGSCDLSRPDQRIALPKREYSLATALCLDDRFACSYLVHPSIHRRALRRPGTRRISMLAGIRVGRRPGDPPA